MIEPELQLGDTDFALLSALIYNRSGICLGPHKRTLLCARLGRRLRTLNMHCFREYYEYATKTDHQELVHMIDAISTNLTEFFREPAHFDYLRENFFSRCRGPVRILSAGCSTGEEPYSIALSALQAFGGQAQQRVQVVACDISTRALQHARRALYREDDTPGVPAELRGYFSVHAEGRRKLLQLRPEVRSLVTFQHLNLAQPFSFPLPFHAIFCRNVAIYFDEATRYAVFNNLRESLVDDGTLFVGHSESLLSFGDKFTFIQPTVYERKLSGRTPLFA